MTWRSQPMTSDCIEYYTRVRKFTLVKETPKALRIRLEDHPEKISIWIPKKITRDYTEQCMEGRTKIKGRERKHANPLREL